MIIPPFEGVRLIEFRDRLELAPVYSYRHFVGLGKFKADEVGPMPGTNSHPLYSALFGDSEIWVVATWRRYEDGQEEGVEIRYLDEETTEQEARKVFEWVDSHLEPTKEDAKLILACMELSEEDCEELERVASGVNRDPGCRPDPKLIEEYDLYQARLKVLAGLQPRTVALMEQACTAQDPRTRKDLEREAVQAYFAELAHYWTEDTVLAWQRANPVGTEWMCEFARVFQEPKLQLDPVNCELVLNWLHRKYNLLTAEELSDEILKATGQRLTPETLKKRRERLGLTTKRPPGPRSKDSQ